MNNSKSLRLILAILYLVMAIGCEHEGDSSDSGNTYSNSLSHESYQDVKETLEDKELNNPLSFLEESATYRKNLLGEFVIEGKIINLATIATFKDAVIEVTYYSRTNTYLGSEHFTIFEYFKPKSKTPFKIKSLGYRGANSVKWEIISAKAAS